MMSPKASAAVVLIAGVLGAAGSALCFGYVLVRWPGIGAMNELDEPVPGWLLTTGVVLLAAAAALVLLLVLLVPAERRRSLPMSRRFEIALLLLLLAAFDAGSLTVVIVSARTSDEFAGPLVPMLVLTLGAPWLFRQNFRT